MAQQIAAFDPIPFCDRLYAALYSFWGGDDELEVESIFFDEGLTDMHLKKIQIEWNKDPGNYISWGARTNKLHEILEDDYRYSGTSTRTGSQTHAGLTGNELCKIMWKSLGHNNPTW